MDNTENDMPIIDKTFCEIVVEKAVRYIYDFYEYRKAKARNAHRQFDTKQDFVVRDAIYEVVRDLNKKTKENRELTDEECDLCVKVIERKFCNDLWDVQLKVENGNQIISIDYQSMFLKILRNEITDPDNFDDFIEFRVDKFLCDYVRKCSKMECVMGVPIPISNGSIPRRGIYKAIENAYEEWNNIHPDDEMLYGCVTLWDVCGLMVKRIMKRLEREHYASAINKDGSIGFICKSCP